VWLAWSFLQAAGFLILALGELRAMWFGLYDHTQLRSDIPDA
jgi:hypothetical protein